MKSSPLYQQTINELKDCYDTHADKFSSTRKKHRPEFERIVNNIDQKSKPNTHQSPLKIVELGCGDGRLYPYLQEQNVPIAHYTGVDISSELIQKAQSHSPKSAKAQRIVDDMLHYLSTRPSESEDIIICVASFQHIPDQQTRNQVLKEVYRVLQYNGLFISIDRSWSQWMLQKHRKLLLKSIITSITQLGKRERNNLMIPFTDKNTIKHRLYHIFTQKEFKLLLKTQGLTVEEMIYSAQDGSFHHSWSQARNICTVARKNVFVNTDH